MTDFRLFYTPNFAKTKRRESCLSRLLPSSCLRLRTPRRSYQGHQKPKMIAPSLPPLHHASKVTEINQGKEELRQMIFVLFKMPKSWRTSGRSCHLITMERRRKRTLSLQPRQTLPSGRTTARADRKGGMVGALQVEGAMKTEGSKVTSLQKSKEWTCKTLCSSRFLGRGALER